MKTKQLILLVPNELPTEHKLREANKEKVFLSINLALESLDVNSQEKAISQVNQALTILGTNVILPADFQAAAFQTGDSNQYSKALDYDNYFNVIHVKSQEPEACLVRSVLLTYQCFLLLVYKSNKFNSENIEIQRQGFRTYFLLLSRVFNLSIN
ncbi:MAG: hypothetical protein QNJ53_24535 [Pleurocapsa sp. MO_192.B19]|nr:hypothetical protein [Pleurocapsa sp. MO_192.B19]